MVHALREAHRALTTAGLLIDLRPAAVHRRVAILRAGGEEPLGAMHERLDEDHAANRAVAQVVAEGLFTVERRSEFPCRRIVDSLDELVTFIGEFAVQHDDPAPHDRLIARARRAFESAGGRPRFAVQAPLVLAELRKCV